MPRIPSGLGSISAQPPDSERIGPPPGGGQGGEVEAVLVVGIEAVVVEVDGDDVLQRWPFHIRARMTRPVKHKRNQG